MSDRKRIDPRALETLFHRRHLEYSMLEARWKRSLDAYSGGANYIEKALIRHVSEIDLEFAERKMRAYYFNYPRAIARRITQYILGTEPTRYHADPDLVEDWSRTGLRANEVMRQLSTLLNVFGRAFLLVESPRFNGRPTIRQAKAEKLRPYVRCVSPLNVVDWGFGSDGRFSWALLKENYREQDDPLKPAVTKSRIRLLEKFSWHLFEEDENGVHEIACGENPTGAVPLVQVEEPDGFGIAANHWFEDVVRISEAILNNESEAQMNVLKQMYGLLVVSDSFARGARKRSGDDSSGSFSATVARSAAIIESVEERGISRFISPSGVASSVIREENIKLKQELFDVVGLAMQGRNSENHTAESKEWDFQHVKFFLADRADLLEEAEQKAWQLIHQFDRDIPVPEVVYNRNFAVRDLEKSISGLLQLSQLDSGREFRRAIRNTAVEMLDELAALPNSLKDQLLCADPQPEKQ